MYCSARLYDFVGRLNSHSLYIDLSVSREIRHVLEKIIHVQYIHIEKQALLAEERRRTLCDSV